MERCAPNAFFQQAFALTGAMGTPSRHEATRSVEVPRGDLASECTELTNRNCLHNISHYAVSSRLCQRESGQMNLDDVPAHTCGLQPAFCPIGLKVYEHSAFHELDKAPVTSLLFATVDFYS